MKISERLEKIIKDLGESPASFADEIRVQRSGISHILSGRNKPSLEFLEKLHSRFPSVDLVWLITGSYAQKSKIHPQVEVEKEELSAKKETIAPKEEAKSVKKSIIALYSDGSFEEFFPRS